MNVCMWDVAEDKILRTRVFVCNNQRKSPLGKLKKSSWELDDCASQAIPYLQS